jgi:outer membrane immunogenic protein
MYRDSLPRFILSSALAVALVPAVAAAQVFNSTASTSGSPTGTPAASTAPRVPTPPVPYSWSGFYLGAHADFARGSADTTFEPLPTAPQFANLQPVTLFPDPNGTGFRISGGANHRSGIFLIGGEADWGKPNTDGEVTQSTDWMVTARGRAGCVFANRVFVYGAAGLAVASVNYYAETDFRPTGTTDYRSDFTKTKIGWTVGLGAEYRLSRVFGIQGEWRWIDLGNESETVDAVPAFPPFQIKYTWKTQSNSVSIGGIVHF